MSTIDLRAELLNEVNALMDNDDLMKEAIETLRSMRRARMKSPCAYSLEEVKERLRRTEADAIAGRGYTLEEVIAMTESLL